MLSAQVRSAVPPAHLLQRQAHAGSAQLEILTGVDVARPGGLGNAMAGCEIVIHAASPFPKRLVDEREAEEVIASCVHGTENAMRGALAHGARKVVITSSMAAVRGAADAPGGGRPFFDYRDWNKSSEPTGPGMQPYQYAKTKAEELAFAFGDEHSLEVVSVLPTCILGPPRAANQRSTSVDLVRGWLRGEGRVQTRLVSDVRDVAAVHLAAMDYTAVGPGSQRRFIVGSEHRGTNCARACVLAQAYRVSCLCGSAGAVIEAAPFRPVPADAMRQHLAAGALLAGMDPGRISPADDWQPTHGVGAHGGKEVDVLTGIRCLCDVV